MPRHGYPCKSKDKTKDNFDGGSAAAVYEELEKLLKRHAPPFRFYAVSGARSKKSIQLTVPKPVRIPGAYGGKLVDLQMAGAILHKDMWDFI